MSKTIKLFLFMFKYKTGITRLKNEIKENKKAARMVVPVALLSLFFIALICLPYVLIMISLYKTVDDMDVYFNTMFIFAQIIVVFSSLMQTINGIFMSTEEELLYAMPIKRGNIFLFNYMTVYICAYAASLVVLLPGICVYMVYSGFSLLFLLKAIIGSLLFTILPLSVCVLAVYALSLLLGRFRHKEMIFTILGIAFLVAYFIGFSMSFNADSNDSTQYMSDLIASKKSLLSTLALYMVNIKLFSSMLTASGISAIIYMVEFIGISAIVLVIAYIAGGALHVKASAGMSQSAAASGKVREKKKSTSVYAFFIKEIKTVFRSSIYSLNCLINLVLGPIAIIVIRMRLENDNDTSEGIINVILTQLEKSGSDRPFISASILLCLTAFITAMNTMPASMISREGNCVWITQIIPVSLTKQIKGKLYASYLMSTIGILSMCVLGGILFKISLIFILYCIFISLLIAAAAVMLSATVDIKRPKLIWEKEAEAVKQNFNTLLGMIIGIIIALCAIVPFAVYLNNIVGMTSCMCVTTVLSAVAATAGYVLIRRATQNMQGLINKLERESYD